MSVEPNPPSGRVLGRSVPRLEDRPLLTGRGQFVGDIAFPRQLHMRVARSPYAHAALRGVDIAAAGRDRCLDRCKYRRSAADRLS